MKLILAVFGSTIMLAATQPPAKKPVQAPAGKQAAKPIKPIEIPPGAVEGEPGRFTYTDAQGKKWIYAKTPFGIARFEDKPADPAAPKPIDPMANVKVIEDGDTVKFERPGPFGVYKWQKKRAELDEQERTAVTKAHDRAPKQDPRDEPQHPSKQD